MTHSPHAGWRSRTSAVIAVLATTLAACAADRPPPKSPEAPSATPTSPAATGGYPGQPYPQPGQPAQPGYPQQQPSQYAQPPPPPATSAGGMPGMPGYPDTPSLQAARDFDVAERELAVATSDCVNACRALSSMDRAAGRICQLSSATEKPRCDDATSKVRTAREKVKGTCGECKETSTDKNAPVPSR